MEIAIDTSTGLAGIALSRQGRVLAEHTWRADFSHTTQLMPAIEAMLAQAGLKPAALEAIGVAVGPGSFSGLRVGLSAAKGLALALGIPLVGVGTLLVEAYPFLGARLPVRPLLDAGRGDISTAVYIQGPLASQGTAGERLDPIEVVPPHISTLEDLLAAVDEQALFCGEHLPALRERLVTVLGDRARFPPDSALLRRAGNLAELAWRRLAQGGAGDAASVQPVYLRGPSITRPRSDPAPVKK